MSSPQSTISDVDLFNQKVRELGNLKKELSSCRRKTSLFGAFTGVLLALSTLGSFSYVVTQETDWSKNPDSPVYELAQGGNGFRVPIAVLLLGFVGGLAMLHRTRKNYARQEHVWIRQNLLILEMRKLRDKLYPKTLHKGERQHSLPTEHPIPLASSEAREEYLGVYSPEN